MPENALAVSRRNNVSTAQSLLGCFWATGSLAAATLLAGYFGQYGWLFDMCSHFRLHQFILLALCTLSCIKTARVLLLIWVPCTLISVAEVAGRYIPETAVASAALEDASHSECRLKVLTMNVESINNRDDKALLNCIRGLEPDVVAIQELGFSGAEYLQANLPAYKYRKMLPDSGFEGIGLMSKLPIRNVDVKSIGINFPTIICSIDTACGAVTFINGHPYAPVTATCWREQLKWGTAMVEVCRSSRDPVIIAGDLNATYWSWPFRRLVEQANLRDTSSGYGIQPTWPTNVHVPGITLDHVLCSPQFTVLQHAPGPFTGSDHLPVLVEMKLRRP